MALGSRIIQKQFAYFDRKLVERIVENPYYQFFIGLPGYQLEKPYAPSLLVEYRKKLTNEILGEINEMIIAHNHPNDSETGENTGDPVSDNISSEDEKPNSGTMMLNVACAPQYIEFPQDINLLNETREILEEIIDTICYEYNEPKPRTYRVNARKDYLAFAKRTKQSEKQIRKAIKKSYSTYAGT